MSSSSTRSFRNKIFEESEEEIPLDKNNYKDEPLMFDQNVEEIIEEIGDLDDKVLHSSIPEPFKHDSSFSKSGKQGVLGTFKLPSGKKCVYKVSQYLNYLVEQENTILQGLNELRDFCPHYVRGFGKFMTKMNSDFRKVDNPFKITGKHNIFNDVLIMEYIDNSRKFYRYLKNDKIEEECIFSVIKQTLMAISYAQKFKNFTHYDLHSNNVLIKTCNPNSVFLYALDDKTQYCVPTYGYYPVLIDFGFGYIKDMDNSSLYGALAHTNIGFLSHIFDKWADPKLFLVTISDELNKYRKSHNTKLFRKIVKNIFSSLNIDWESGWDNVDDINCSDRIYNMIKREGKFSKFFRESGQYCVDILQSLISLPVKRRKYKQIDEVYRMMVDEFHKIELEISSVFYNLYIFKKTVDAAKMVKTEYSNRDTMEDAVKRFKHMVLDAISHVASYCHPKLDWDRLLCSMIVLSRQMEGVIYEYTNRRWKEKNEEYDDIELKNVDEVFECIDTNIPSHFVFDEETDVYVWDCNIKNSKKIKLSKRCVQKLNELHPSERGAVIYNFYTKYQQDD